MYGTTIGSLDVYINIAGRNKTKVWTRSGAQGNQWLVDHVDVAKYLNSATEYTLMFEATRGTSFTGDIALDDLFFGPCGK